MIDEVERLRRDAQERKRKLTECALGAERKGDCVLLWNRVV